MGRRRFLRAGLALVLAGVAGCAGSEPDGATTVGSATTPETGASTTDRKEMTTADGKETTAPAGETATPTGTEPATVTEPDTADLDLREANVTGVEIERRGDGYRLSVTLYHDDDGEDGYANWWQVESLDGERLGRRELLHAHGTREFTRSATIEIPDRIGCVVVRGHDETHGYGGQAVLVSLGTGATRAVRQGGEPRSFDEPDCP